MKTICRVIMCAIISSVLLAGPLYSIELPSGLVILESEVMQNIASNRREVETLAVPEAEDSVPDGHASLYFSDRSQWEFVPADVPIRLFMRTVIRSVRAGRGHEVPLSHFSGAGVTVFEEGGVYVLDYIEPELLVDNPRELQGHISMPSEYEQLPESASRVNPIPLLLMGLAIGGWAGFMSNIEDGTIGSLVLAGAAIVGGQGGLLVLDMTEDNMWRRDVELGENIAENERRRSEFEREQRRIEAANEELLEGANEETRLRNRHAHYVLVTDVKSGRASRVWLSD